MDSPPKYTRPPTVGQQPRHTVALVFRPLDAQTPPDCRARKYGAGNGPLTREGPRENGLGTVRSS